MGGGGGQATVGGEGGAAGRAEAKPASRPTSDSPVSVSAYSTARPERRRETMPARPSADRCSETVLALSPSRSASALVDAGRSSPASTAARLRPSRSASGSSSSTASSPADAHSAPTPRGAYATAGGHGPSSDTYVAAFPNTTGIRSS